MQFIDAQQRIQHIIVEFINLMRHMSIENGISILVLKSSDTIIIKMTITQDLNMYYN